MRLEVCVIQETKLKNSPFNSRVLIGVTTHNLEMALLEREFCKVKVNSFQKGFFYIEGFHFYKVNIHFLKIFLDSFSNFFLLKLKLFRHNSYYNKYLFRSAPKIGKKVGIHFYENILSEINLPLPKL